jgi:hypothetical protein
VRIVRLLVLSVNLSNNKLSLSKVSDFTFGGPGPGDNPSDVISYEGPALEVNNNGDVVIAYVRRGINMVVKPFYNEAGYSVYYHNGTLSPPALLKKGEGAISTPPYTNEPFAVQSLDPTDGITVWVDQAYARANGSYAMAWGAVKPPQQPQQGGGVPKPPDCEPYKLALDGAAMQLQYWRYWPYPPSQNPNLQPNPQQQQQKADQIVRSEQAVAVAEKAWEKCLQGHPPRIGPGYPGPGPLR